MDDDERQVRAALDHLMDAFRRGDDDEYFDCFHPRAVFLFHGQPRLDGRDAYRAEKASWKRDHGFEVLDATSRGAVVHLFGGVAIVCHSVETRQRWDGDQVTLQERESIVFGRDEGRWVALHEHLSADHQ